MVLAVVDVGEAGGTEHPIGLRLGDAALGRRCIAEIEQARSRLRFPVMRPDDVVTALDETGANGGADLA